MAQAHAQNVLHVDGAMFGMDNIIQWMLIRMLYKRIHTGWGSIDDFSFNVVQLLCGYVYDLCIARLAKKWKQPPSAPSDNLGLFYCNLGHQLQSGGVPVGQIPCARDKINIP